MTATIGLPWAEVTEEPRSWPDAREGEEVVDIFGEEPADYMGSPAVRAASNLRDSEATLYPNSRRRRAGPCP